MLEETEGILFGQVRTTPCDRQVVVLMQRANILGVVRAPVAQTVSVLEYLLPLLLGQRERAGRRP
jgi:hypothetical protein